MPPSSPCNLSFPARVARAQALETETLPTNKSQTSATNNSQAFTSKNSQKALTQPRRVLTIKGDAALELALRTGRVAREKRGGEGEGECAAGRRGREKCEAGQGGGRRRELGGERRDGKDGEGMDNGGSEKGEKREGELKRRGAVREVGRRS